MSDRIVLRSSEAAALTAGRETGSVYNGLHNPGLVLVEYFGFLRHDPDDTPDIDVSEFDFRPRKMDSFTLAREEARSESGAFERIKREEMVKAFILTDECRRRFGRYAKGTDGRRHRGQEDSGGASNMHS